MSEEQAQPVDLSVIQARVERMRGVIAPVEWEVALMDRTTLLVEVERLRAEVERLHQSVRPTGVAGKIVGVTGSSVLAVEIIGGLNGRDSFPWDGRLGQPVRVIMEDRK
jgi:hypothetical protein